MTVMEYLVIVERGERNCSAYVPDLPGCVATGKSVEETSQNIREAMLWHLETMRADGDPIPEPTSTSITVAV